MLLGIKSYCSINNAPFCCPFNFSIGDEYANVFMETDAYCDSPQMLEKRKQRGNLIFAGAISMCQLFVSKIFACKSLNVLNALLHPLLCIYKLCVQFPVDIEVRRLKLKKKIELQSIYNPLYPNALQMDCFHHLIEIGFFSKHMKNNLDNIEEDNIVIAANHIGFLISQFLQTFC